MTVLVSRLAPDFTAPAVAADGSIIAQYNLHSQIKDKYALLLFYPLDFTFVCPTEIIALDHRVKAFKERGVEVIGVSIDSHYTHNAWRNTPVDQGGIGPVNFTLVADITHSICQSYGVEHPVASVAFRAAVIIDKKGIVRVQNVNDLQIGRNIDELVRLVDAVQFNDAHGEVCPAGWKKGDVAMKPTSEGVAAYLSEHGKPL